MKKEKFLIPKRGLIVRDPRNKNILPENGTLVLMNTYWKRRLKCGDVYEKEQIETKIFKENKKNLKNNNMEE